MKKYISIKKALLQATDSVNLLNSLAEDGWFIDKIGTTFITFKQSSPRSVNYHLQYNNKKLDKPFEYIGVWDDIQIYLKEDQAEANMQTFEDIQYTLSKHYPTKILPITLFLDIGLITMGLFAASMESRVFNFWTMNVYTCLFLFLMLALIFTLRCINIILTNKMINKAKQYTELNFKQSNKLNTLDSILLPSYLVYVLIFLSALTMGNVHLYANKVISIFASALIIHYIPIKKEYIKLIIFAIICILIGFIM